MVTTAAKKTPNIPYRINTLELVLLSVLSLLASFAMYLLIDGLTYRDDGPELTKLKDCIQPKDENLIKPIELDETSVMRANLDKSLPPVVVPQELPAQAKNSLIKVKYNAFRPMIFSSQVVDQKTADNLIAKSRKESQERIGDLTKNLARDLESAFSDMENLMRRVPVMGEVPFPSPAFQMMKKILDSISRSNMIGAPVPALDGMGAFPGQFPVSLRIAPVSFVKNAPKDAKSGASKTGKNSEEHKKEKDVAEVVKEKKKQELSPEIMTSGQKKEARAEGAKPKAISIAKPVVEGEKTVDLDKELLDGLKNMQPKKEEGEKKARFGDVIIVPKDEQEAKKKVEVAANELEHPLKASPEKGEKNIVK